MKVSTLAALTLALVLTAVDAHADTPVVAILNARAPLPNVLSGGQPSQLELQRAAELGFKTVINLRSQEEEPDFVWEPHLVEQLGMTYVHLPVNGGDGLTLENVQTLDRLLAESTEKGPVLLHCASGNRIGAMLALREAWLYELPAGAALAFGLDAGLTSLEDRTRELLPGGAPAAP